MYARFAIVARWRIVAAIGASRRRPATKLGREQLAIKIEGSAIDRSGMIRGCPAGQSTPGL